jgi:hypothetical protein
MTKRSDAEAGNGTGTNVLRIRIKDNQAKQRQCNNEAIADLHFSKRRSFP